MSPLGAEPLKMAGITKRRAQNVPGATQDRYGVSVLLWGADEPAPQGREAGQTSGEGSSQAPVADREQGKGYETKGGGRDDDT